MITHSRDIENEFNKWYQPTAKKMADDFRMPADMISQRPPAMVAMAWMEQQKRIESLKRDLQDAKESIDSYWNINQRLHNRNNKLEVENRILKESVELTALWEDHLPECRSHSYIDGEDYPCKCYDHAYYNKDNVISTAREALRRIDDYISKY